MGRSTMPVNLVIKEGYAPKVGYDKTIKAEKIKKMQDQVDAAISQTLQESQTDGEGGELNPHTLSREQNDKTVECAFGPSKKKRRRFRGSGVWTSGDTTTSFESTMPSMSSSMQRPNEVQAVTQLTEHVTHILATKLSPAIFATAMPLMIGGFTTSDALDTAKRSIVMSLAGKIPDDVYLDIVRDIMGPDAGSSQRRDSTGSTSAILARDTEDAGADDDDGGEE